MNENVLTKYRPTSLDDMVLSGKNRLELKNILANPHKFNVYLLLGNTGIGKTTFARIFANSLSSDTEIIELNCLENRGIDDAHGIAEAVGSRTVLDAPRVIILDEAHGLTNAAQNRLLKPLEEIPSNNFVFLCSTNPRGLIEPLVSRCRKINFEISVTRLKDPSSDEFLSLFDYACMITDSYKNGSELQTSFINSVILNYIKAVNKVSLRQFTTYLINCIDNQLVGEYVEISTDKKSAIDLARILSSTNPDVKSCVSIFKEITETPESIRITLLNYFAAILLSNLTNHMAQKNVQILLEAESNETQTDAKAKLILAISKILMSQQ